MSSYKRTDSCLGDSGAKDRFAPEFKLALACAHWPLSDENRADIRRLAASDINWNQFLRIVDRNQMLPLAHRNLRDALPEGQQQECLDALRKKAVDFASHSLSQAAELVRISEAARGAGVEIIALKGVSLSVLAYGHVALRSPGDIDLLIAPAHVFEFERILLELGYARYEPRAKLTPRRRKHYLKYYKHFAYSCEARAVALEVHWRLFHNTHIREPDLQPFATVEVPVGSGTIPTLSPNELFLYLCVHGAIHGWPILKWLADIAAMLRVMTAEDLHSIAAIASQRHLVAELHAALILVDSLVAVERPSIQLPRQADPVTERIVAMSRRLLTTHDYCLEITDLPRFGMFFYDLGIGPSWRYRSEDIRRAFVLPDDWDLVDLPDALFPLYAAVRPVSWLMRHFSRLSRRLSALDQPSSPLSS